MERYLQEQLGIIEEEHSLPNLTPAEMIAVLDVQIAKLEYCLEEARHLREVICTVEAGKE